jgi:hypothetical protein
MPIFAKPQTVSTVESIFRPIMNEQKITIIIAAKIRKRRTVRSTKNNTDSHTSMEIVQAE